MKEAGSLKASCNIAHANQQGFERYGFTPAIISKIVDSVKFVNGKSSNEGYKAIGLRPDKSIASRYLYAVAVDLRWIPVIWCKSTNTIVTVLPEDCLGEYYASLPKLATKKVEEFPYTHYEIDAELEEIRAELVSLNTARKVEGIELAEKKSINASIEAIGLKRKQLLAIKLTLPKESDPEPYNGLPELEHFRIIRRLVNMVRLTSSLLDVPDESDVIDSISDANAYLKRNGIAR